MVYFYQTKLGVFLDFLIKILRGCVSRFECCKHFFLSISTSLGCFFFPRFSFLSASNTNTGQHSSLTFMAGQGVLALLGKRSNLKLICYFAWKNLKNIFGIDSFHIVNRNISSASVLLNLRNVTKLMFLQLLCSQPDIMRNGCDSSILKLKEC